MKKRLSFAILLALSGLCWNPATAWGPVGQLSVVATAVHVLSQDGSIPLLKLDRYVWEGARISADAEAAFFPNFGVDPVGTIEREMHLLQSVRSDRVDPYYAFRLGVLGKLVAQATAPLANGTPAYRKMYYADVDKHIERMQMRVSKRSIVDPPAYFATVIQAARSQQATIEKDYQSGGGFNGVARASLAIDASRSVDAVADVWYTILTSNAAFPTVSDSTLQNYTLGGLKYYLDQGKALEARDVYERAREMGILAMDLRKAIGDLYLDAKFYEQAMAEYEAVLKDAPGRRDVVLKVARYYEEVGRDALQAGRLEEARDAFAAALAADKLQAGAQRTLFEIESQIAARDKRLAEIVEAMAAGQRLENDADVHALNRNYAQAIELLRSAEAKYRTVSDEFLVQAKTTDSYLRNVATRMREYKNQLITNAQTLSGTGFERDARRIAGATPGVDEEALRTMLKIEFRSAVKQLEDKLKS